MLSSALKALFPEVPEEIVARIIEQALNDREVCIEMLGRESRKYRRHSDDVPAVIPFSHSNSPTVTGETIDYEVLQGSTGVISNSSSSDGSCSGMGGGDPTQRMSSTSSGDTIQFKLSPLEVEMTSLQLGSADPPFPVPSGFTNMQGGSSSEVNYSDGHLQDIQQRIPLYIAPSNSQPHFEHQTSDASVFVPPPTSNSFHQSTSAPYFPQMNYQFAYRPPTLNGGFDPRTTAMYSNETFVNTSVNNVQTPDPNHLYTPYQYGPQWFMPRQPNVNAFSYTQNFPRGYITRVFSPASMITDTPTGPGFPASFFDSPDKRRFSAGQFPPDARFGGPFESPRFSNPRFNFRNPYSNFGGSVDGGGVFPNQDTLWNTSQVYVPPKSLSVAVGSPSDQYGGVYTQVTPESQHEIYAPSLYQTSYPINFMSPRMSTSTESVLNAARGPQYGSPDVAVGVQNQGTSPDDKRRSAGSLSGRGSKEEIAYLQALQQCQELHLDRLRTQHATTFRRLQSLRTEIEQMDLHVRRLRAARKDNFPTTYDVDQLVNENHQVSSDIQQLTRKVDLVNNGQALLGVIDPSDGRGLIDNSRVVLPSAEQRTGSTGTEHSPGLNHRLLTSTTASETRDPHRILPVITPSYRSPPPPYSPQGFAQPPPPHLEMQDEPRFTSVEESDQQWSCSACTFLNHPALSECECCAFPKVVNVEAPSRH